MASYAKIQTMHKVGYGIRPMNDGDISQVSEIDREAFPGESLFRPYTSYKQEIHNSLARYIVACSKEEVDLEKTQQDKGKISWFKHLFFWRHTMSMKGEQCNPGSVEYIVGFAGLWFMLDEAHITAIAVRSNYRRSGIGEGLLISTIELARQINAKIITLEVRASNMVAQALYQKYGFRVAGNRPRYYSDDGEDAVLMRTDGITSESFQTSFHRLKEAHRQRWDVSSLAD